MSLHRLKITPIPLHRHQCRHRCDRLITRLLLYPLVPELLVEKADRGDFVRENEGVAVWWYLEGLGLEGGGGEDGEVRKEGRFEGPGYEEVVVVVGGWVAVEGDCVLCEEFDNCGGWLVSTFELSWGGVVRTYRR
jgi:hypothetical protein